MLLVGRESNIAYQGLFNAYKQIIITNSYNKDKATRELFQFYNGIVFDWERDRKRKGKVSAFDNSLEDSELDVSSGVDAAIRPRFDAMDLHDEAVDADYYNPGIDSELEEIFEVQSAVSTSLHLWCCLMVKKWTDS